MCFAMKGAFTAQFVKQGMFDPDLVAENIVFDNQIESQLLED